MLKLQSEYEEFLNEYIEIKYTEYCDKQELTCTDLNAKSFYRVNSYFRLYMIEEFLEAAKEILEIENVIS